MTLPHNATADANDKVCRYTGVGVVWDCAANSFVGSTITRNNITELSDWATGNDITPLAVTLLQPTNSAAKPTRGCGWSAGWFCSAARPQFYNGGGKPNLPPDLAGLQDLLGSLLFFSIKAILMLSPHSFRLMVYLTIFLSLLLFLFAVLPISIM